MDNIVHSDFETRRPVAGGEFHDRIELIDRLGALLGRHLDGGKPSWVLLLGPRKIGKTSILRELRRRVAGSALIASLDLFRVDARVHDVFAAFVRALLAGAAVRVGRPELATRLDAGFDPELSHALSLALPHPFTARALELLTVLQRARSVDNDTVALALDLPERMAEVLGPVWVVLDEVQELHALNRQRPFSARHDVLRLMRSVWQSHERVSYWATGSHVSMLTRLFAAKRAPFHGHFQLVPVEPFAPSDAAALLRSRFADESPEAADAAELAARTLGGHPFYLQVLGEELALRGLPLRSNALKSVLQDVLLNPSGRLALHLQTVLEADAGSGQHVAVLRALAREESTLAGLAQNLRGGSKDSAHAILRRLAATDLVSKDERSHRYRIADPALAALLRTGGLGAEPAPAVLGDEGERIAARHLLAQGIRPVYQSYRSLGPADLVTLEPGRKLAVQVKRTSDAIYLGAVERARLAAWAEREGLVPVLCQVTAEEKPEVRYWRLADGAPAGKRLRFDAERASASVLEWVRE